MVGRLARENEIGLPGFRVRDIREADREEVLALTANTWESGDYIKWVFNDWLNDKQGRFLAVFHIETGKLAAIDKMSFLSPDEAWFEGLRVAPAFRGHGLASRLQTYMIEEARAAGARVVRLLTSTGNSAVQRMAYRDGFMLKALVSFWKWEEAAGLPTDGDALRLRPAAPDEADGLYTWWLRSSAYRTNGLCHRNWSYSETNVEEWSLAAREGRLLVLGDSPADAPLPPPAALVASVPREDGGTLWTMAALSAHGPQWPLLLSGLIATARAAGIAEVNGLFPRDPVAEAAFQVSGFSLEDEGDSLCLFELNL